MTINQHKLLSDTKNFDANAEKVFRRIIENKGPGLLVLWGGSSDNPVKANKTYFLNMIETVQDGVDAITPYLAEYVMQLVGHSFVEKYQCIRVKEDSGIPYYPLYSTPLSTTLALAYGGAIYRKGWVIGRKVVILCDDIDHFTRSSHAKENEQFLRELAIALDNQTLITFIGTSRLGWNAEAVLGHERVLHLGWA